MERNNEPANYAAECQPDTERRDSDLCAQWKAADAASESAGWTRWSWHLGLVGAIIGFLTLCAASAAAYFAKKAADHTETGANTAKDGLEHAQTVSATELRAWVSVGVEAQRVYRKGVPLCFEYDVVCHNHGQTIARGYMLFAKLIFPTEDQSFADAVSQQWDQWREPSTMGRAAVMPGETDTFAGFGAFSMDILPWGRERDGHKGIVPVVAVSVFYRTDFDDDWHRTDRSFTIGRRDQAHTGMYVRDDVEAYEPDDIVAQPISMSLAT